MEYASVDMYYEEHGKGTPVILVHGFPLNHAIWNPLVPYLKDEARLILPDLRGYGQSPQTAGTYSMRLLAEDLLRLMDRLELERVVLVGHSMGGYACLAFAHAYQSRLAGLALVASHSFADTPERRQSRLKTAASVRRKGVKPVADHMIETLAPRRDVAEQVMSIMLSCSPEGVEGSLRGMAERPDMTGELSNICVPTVVVVGTNDKIVSPEQANTMIQMLPMSWIAPIENAGHLLMMEEPQQVAEALRPLIQRAEQANK